VARLAEEAQATAEDHREDHEPQLVDEFTIDQGVDELPAPPGLVVVGVLFLGDLSWFDAHLSPDSNFGWVPIITGGSVAASLVLLP
jgi:hypothetical protein